MNNWRQRYQSKLIPVQEAARKIKSGDRVALGLGCGEARATIKEALQNKERYENVEIFQVLSLGKGEYADPEMTGHFRYNTMYVSGSVRGAINEGRAEYIPCFFYEVPRLFRQKQFPLDVAIIQVSPPDEHGYCSFGVSVEYMKAAADCAGLVIAEVNDQMPRTLGDSFIHVSQIDYMVEVSCPITEVPSPKITEVEQTIGENCAALVEDGSTLQLGIGAIPDAVAQFLMDKKDLGIHSEMFSDSVVQLVEAGVVTCKAKKLHQGKMVATFLMGTKRLYDFVHNNPMVAMYPVEYVNNPFVIAQNSKMVAINSALQVDFMGQVAAESMGLNQYSGTGGQVDFIRGANSSQEGKSIIAMPSTAANGTISRITPVLTEGTAVTTSRNDVHYIVTEYGIADLRGKSLQERGKSLIKIAHPRFRAELQEAWEKRFKGKNCEMK